MKSILLIGLGRFGKHIAMHLNNLGHQVMAVDNSEDRVEAVLPFVTNAQIGDSTNAAFLESLGIRNYDVCIVAILSPTRRSAGFSRPPANGHGDSGLPRPIG